MLKQRHMFLTGITGSLGSWIAKVALAEGTHITALVRADSLAEARERAYHALSVVGAESYFEQLTILVGDITQSERPEVGKVDLVLHCAAAMDFAESARPLLEKVNIDGTRQVLAWTEGWSVPLVHVSTAYVAGNRCDRALETDIDTGQGFHNPYEETKCEAEKLVQDWAKRTGLPLTVLRPSIVVGDTQSGQIINFDGLYTLMRFFDAIASNLGDQRFRATACAEATKNVVPVDWVAHSSWSIIKQGLAGTYHLTHPNPMTMQQLKDWFVDLFEVPGGQLASPEDFENDPPSRLEQVFHRAAATYLPYLVEETIFDRTNTEEVLGQEAHIDPIDRDFVARLLKTARQARWGKRLVKSMPRSAPPAAVADYFEEFLYNRRNRPLVPDMHRLDATCRIQLEEWPDHGWTLDIKKGAIKDISTNGASAACTFTLDHPTFSEIIAGRLTPQKAFIKQRVNISGNMETGLRLATALAAFFKECPYHLAEEDAA